MAKHGGYSFYLRWNWDLKLKYIYIFFEKKLSFKLNIEDMFLFDNLN